MTTFEGRFTESSALRIAVVVARFNDLVTSKHCVLYDDSEEKWYQMASKTFYIISRDKALKESKTELELEEKSIYDEPLSDE